MIRSAGVVLWAFRADCRWLNRGGVEGAHGFSDVETTDFRFLLSAKILFSCPRALEVADALLALCAASKLFTYARSCDDLSDWGDEALFASLLRIALLKIFLISFSARLPFRVLGKRLAISAQRLSLNSWYTCLCSSIRVSSSSSEKGDLSRSGSTCKRSSSRKSKYQILLSICLVSLMVCHKTNQVAIGNYVIEKSLPALLS